MGDDLLDSPRRDTLEIRFHDRIHQSFLHPGIASEDLRLEGELPELEFSEERLPTSDFEGSALVAVPMRLPRIDSLVRIGSGRWSVFCNITGLRN